MCWHTQIVHQCETCLADHWLRREYEILKCSHGILNRRHLRGHSIAADAIGACSRARSALTGYTTGVLKMIRIPIADRVDAIRPRICAHPRCLLLAAVIKIGGKTVHVISAADIAYARRAAIDRLLLFAEFAIGTRDVWWSARNAFHEFL